jgi:hypothetical protein
MAGTEVGPAEARVVVSIPSNYTVGEYGTYLKIETVLEGNPELKGATFRFRGRFTSPKAPGGERKVSGLFTPPVEKTIPGTREYPSFAAKDTALVGALVAYDETVAAQTIDN